MKRTTVTIAAAALALFFAAAAEGRDVYKGFIDPYLFPHHRAIVDILQKLETDPKNAALKNDLGLLIARDGFWRDAIREFEEAAKLDPKLATKAYFNAGLVSLGRGENSTARSYFKKSVSKDPGNWTAWWMLGLTEERLFNIGGAVEAYKTSLRVDTSLFDPAKNPFAIESRLRSRVLLETYQKRRVRAAQPLLEQFAEAERIQALLQFSKPPTPVPSTPPEPTKPPEPTPAPVPVVPIAPPMTISTPPGGQPAPPPRTKGPDVKPIDRGSEPQPPQPETPPGPAAPASAPAPAPVSGPGGPPMGFADRPSAPTGSDRPSGVKGVEQGGPGPGGFDAEPPATPPPPK